MTWPAARVQLHAPLYAPRRRRPVSPKVHAPHAEHPATRGERLHLQFSSMPQKKQIMYFNRVTKTDKEHRCCM